MKLPRTSVVQGAHTTRRGVARQTRAAAWLLLCCWALSVLHAQQSPELPAPLAALLPELKSQTGVPLLLPHRLPPLAQETVYAHAKADADGYAIRLESDPDCDGANACFLGLLRAKRGGRFSYPEVLKLSDTVTGRYKPTTCGGSCSAQAIEWQYQGVLYTAQLNLRTESEKEARAEMIELARSAVRSGLR